MKILVTNDDGITSPGLRRLTAELAKIADVYVVAPAEQQSAKSQSITFMKPVRVSEAGVYGAREAYELEGTPADCVIWAVPWFRERGIRFDYLFSGINMGTNIGLSVYYSGTVAAAREGALNGVRSIAYSVANHDATEFDFICRIIPKILEMSASLSPSTVLNVNAPNLPEWETKGLCIADTAPWGYGEKFAFSETGTETFRMDPVRIGEKVTAGPDMKFDIDCLDNGYAAVSPLSVKMSDDVALDRLRGLFPQGETLVLFTDVQDKNISGAEGRDRFLANSVKFARCVSRLGLPAVITEIYGLGATDGDLRRSCGKAETVVRREYSAAASAEFRRLLARTPYRKVIIAGAETHASVLRTALDFAAKGYDVTVVEDCCAARSGHDHKMAIAELRDAGVRVTTARAAVSELLYTTGHPAAEAVRRIMEE